MPLTVREHQAAMHQPALCELLPVRDFLDEVAVRTNGAFVAGYELGGMNSYYHDDEMRNRVKASLEGLVRSLPAVRTMKPTPLGGFSSSIMSRKRRRVTSSSIFRPSTWSRRP